MQSNVAGTVVIDATAAVTISGAIGSDTVNVSVDGYGAFGTIGRTKIWVDGTRRWLKHDGAGLLLGGAVFTVCRTDTFNSDTSVMDNTTDFCFDVYDENDGNAGTSGDAGNDPRRVPAQQPRPRPLHDRREDAASGLPR